MQHRDWLFGKSGALFMAAATGDLALVKELLKDGADINTASKNGYTPLHRAAQNGHLEVTKHLIEHGADPKATSIDNKTPLTIATEHSQTIIADLLRKAI